MDIFKYSLNSIYEEWLKIYMYSMESTYLECGAIYKYSMGPIHAKWLNIYTYSMESIYLVGEAIYKHSMESIKELIETLNHGSL